MDSQFDAEGKHEPTVPAFTSYFPLDGCPTQDLDDAINTRHVFDNSEDTTRGNLVESQYSRLILETIDRVLEQCYTFRRRSYLGLPPYESRGAYSPSGGDRSQRYGFHANTSVSDKRQHFAGNDSSTNSNGEVDESSPTRRSLDFDTFPIPGRDSEMDQNLRTMVNYL